MIDDSYTLDRSMVATVAGELWDTAHNGYAIDGYTLDQVHDALWAAFREAIDELLEDLAWSATSSDDSYRLGRRLRHYLDRTPPAGPPLDEKLAPDEELGTAPRQLAERALVRAGYNT